MVYLKAVLVGLFFVFVGLAGWIAYVIHLLHGHFGAGTGSAAVGFSPAVFVQPFMLFCVAVLFALGFGTTCMMLRRRS